MAIAPARSMQQIGPRTWTFQGPRVAPMKAHCRACQLSVAIVEPESLDLHTGNYVVRGRCERCGQEVLLIVS